MKPSVSVCCLSLLLLVSIVGGKAVSDLQSLKQLLEEETDAAPYSSSEEMEVEEKRAAAGRSVSWGAREPALKHGVLARLFNDLLRSSKRSWSRYKKGGLRSCFGVRLDRIGSFSGLGC